MGMYTEFVFGASLREDTPKHILEILERMFDGIPKDSDPKFRTIPRGCSYGFGFSNPLSKLSWDYFHKQRVISIRCSLKNYNEEIENFVKWIRPYVDRGSGNRNMLGYSMYENGEEPKIFYLTEMGVMKP